MGPLTASHPKNGVLVPSSVTGGDRYRELFDTLTKTKGAIKVFCEVDPLDDTS